MPSTIYFIAFSLDHILCPCVGFFLMRFPVPSCMPPNSWPQQLPQWLHGFFFSSLPRCELDFTTSEYYLPFQFDVNLGQISPRFNISQNHCIYVTAMGLGTLYTKPMLQIYTASVAIIQYSVMEQCFWIISWFFLSIFILTSIASVSLCTETFCPLSHLLLNSGMSSVALLEVNRVLQASVCHWFM